jgi:predicted lipid-binding transport protein (Tim44 family)
MVGGAGYMAGKHRAQSQEADQQQEGGQDERISALEQQQAAPQQTAAPQAAAPQAAAPAGGASIVDKLKELSDLKTSGALNDAQFEQAKAQLLGGG